jgi:hypothetical protein
MAMLLAILDFLFGCHHVHLSRVFTLKGETYKVCCDCGGKFAYSLETMSIERRLPLTPVLIRIRIACDMEKEHEHTQSENDEKVKSTPQLGSGPQLQSPLREPGTMRSCGTSPQYAATAIAG